MLFLSRQMLPRPTLTISTLLQIRTYNSRCWTNMFHVRLWPQLGGSNKSFVVRFFIELLVMLYLSLWDGAATSSWGNLCSGYTTHSVMVVITVNPKIFGGIGGTEEVLPRVEIFTVPLQSQTTRLGSSVSSSKMVGRQKRSSVVCTGCSRRLDKSKTSLQCNRCVSPNVTGVIRFHVE